MERLHIVHDFKQGPLPFPVPLRRRQGPWRRCFQFPEFYDNDIKEGEWDSLVNEESFIPASAEWGWETAVGLHDVDVLLSGFRL